MEVDARAVQPGDTERVNQERDIRLKLSIGTAIKIDCFILVSLIIGRTIYSLNSGYILPDEAFYYNLFVVQGLGFSVYRPILHLFYVLFFFGTDSMIEMFVRGALFCAFWAVGCVWLLSKVLKALEISEKPAALVILSFVLLPCFPLMAVFFVTETMALFFALAGIWFAIQYSKDRSWKKALLTAAMFLFASQVREPYLLFLFGTPLILVLMRRTWKAAAGYGSIALIAFPFPNSIHPLSLSEPVSNILFEAFPNYAIYAADRFAFVLNSLNAYIQSLILDAPKNIAALFPSPHQNGVGSSVQTVISSIGSIISASPPAGSGVPAPPPIPSYVFQAANTVHVTLGWPEFYAFALGLAWGLGPVFVCLIVIALYPAVKKSILVAAFSGFGLVSFFVTANFAVEYLPNAIGLWTSNIIRLSSAALPAVIGLGYLYERIRPQTVATAIFATLMLGLALAPSFSSAIQSSQNVQGGNVNRISFDYQAPYLRMAQTAQPGSLIIEGRYETQLQVMLSFTKNVTIAFAPATLTGFHELTAKNYTTIYLYDDWVNLNSTFIKACQCYPDYYPSILFSNSVTLLWSNGESYALELRR